MSFPTLAVAHTHPAGQYITSPTARLWATQCFATSPSCSLLKVFNFKTIVSAAYIPASHLAKEKSCLARNKVSFNLVVSLMFSRSRIVLNIAQAAYCFLFLPCPASPPPTKANKSCATPSTEIENPASSSCSMRFCKTHACSGSSRRTICDDCCVF